MEDIRLFIPIEEHEDIKADGEDGSCTAEDGKSNRYIGTMTGTINGSDIHHISPDSEATPQTAGPVHRLSTFIPTESNVLSETDTEWTIRLQRNDVRF